MGSVDPIEVATAALYTAILLIIVGMGLGVLAEITGSVALVAASVVVGTLGLLFFLLAIVTLAWAGWRDVVQDWRDRG